MNGNNQTVDYRFLLEKDGVFAQLPVGISMLPMLKHRRDTVIIEKLKEKPKENDVVLYQRDCGKYVLHRIIKVKEDGYVIRGDNCYKNEYDIKDRHIFGILTGFYKKEKYIDCKTNKLYKFYVWFWRRIFYIRIPFILFNKYFSIFKYKLSKLIKTKK